MSKARTTSNKKSSEGHHTGISEAYYQELLETFQLFSNKETDTLSIKNLQLAMRTLGFDASLDDIIDIVKDMPSLSVHKGKKRQAKPSRAPKGKGTSRRNNNNNNKAAAAASESTRKSSRTVASRAGQKSRYVDSDEDEYEDEDQSDDDDNDDDVYRGNEDDGKEDEDDDEEDELIFTLQDFVTLMSPSEEEHAQDEISRVFQLFDTAGRGSIRVEDLRRVASELGMAMKDQELQEMIEEADRDGDGGVTEQEFARIMKKTGF
ncbi:hypothetical protein BGX33_009663 [Mortierella sp. NVP41]|nr:hypothetical protein BGX33_009663 [Mortierella sp. NVP41]